MSENHSSEKPHQFVEPSIQIAESDLNEEKVNLPSAATDELAKTSPLSVLTRREDEPPALDVKIQQGHSDSPQCKPPSVVPGIVIACLYLISSIATLHYSYLVVYVSTAFVALSVSWCAACLFKIRSAIKEDLPEADIGKPTKILVMWLMLFLYVLLQGTTSSASYGDKPDYLSNTFFPFILYVVVVQSTWLFKLGRFFDSRSKSPRRHSTNWSARLPFKRTRVVPKTDRVDSQEQPRVGKYAVLLALISVLSFPFVAVFPFFVWGFVAFLNSLLSKLKDKSHLAELSSLSTLEGKERVVLRYRVFAAFERWLKQRFLGHSLRRKSQLGPVLAIVFTLLVIPLLLLFADANTLSPIARFFASFTNSTAAPGLEAATSNNGTLLARSFFGFVGMAITLVIYAYLKQPTNVELSRVGVRLFTKLGKRETSKGRFLAWGDITRVDLHQPSSKTNVSDCELVFVAKEGQSLRLKLGSLESIADKELILKGIEKWAPSVNRSAEVIQALQAPSNHSYTELWLQALSGPPKREKLKPLVEGAIVKDGLYTVVRSIGIGGQGFAYLAKNNLTGESVVLKEFLLPVFVDMSVRKKALVKFENEAKILKQLDHPQIVKLLDFLVEDHRAYLVLEHIDGLSMRKIVKQQGKLPESQVRDLAKQMCTIQTYLHSLSPPVVHRDFTPDNLILRKDGTLKVIDFNVAQQIESTATGSVVGKHAYLPPEQFRGQPVPQSDIYALGATVSFLLTGQDPEPITESHPRQTCPSISENMDALVAKATSTELAGRYSAVDQLAADLDYILTEQATKVSNALQPYFDNRLNAPDAVAIPSAMPELDLGKVTLKVSDDASAGGLYASSSSPEETAAEVPSKVVEHKESEKSDQARAGSLPGRALLKVVEASIWTLAIMSMVWPYIPEAAHGYFDPAWYQNRHLYKATKVWNLVDTRNKADVQHFSALITAECNQAIKEDPSCYGAYMIRSNVYEYSGDLKNAVTDALKYASLQPTDMSIYPVLGRIYDKLQLPEEAFRAWDKALGGQQAPPSDKLHVVSMAPDFFFHGASTTRLYENRGWDEVKLGNFKSAMKDLAWVDYLRGGDDWQTVELAMAYAMDGDPDRSLTLLKNYSSSFSSTYYDAHKTMRVLKQYVWSLERAQKRDRATFVSLGKALGFRWIDQSQRVMPELNKVIATDPQFADLYVWRGTESWRDNPALALSQYNKALQLDPGNALALYYRAALFNDQKNYNSAISDCNQLLHGDFRNNALAMRAETYLGLHRYADAAADCANALASEQAWTDAHVLMADALERQGITEGALQQLHQARDYYGEGRCNTDLATINAGIDRLEKMKKDRK